MTINCPYCSRAAMPYLSVTDFFVSREEFSLYHCPSCDFLFTHPVPENLGKYYDSLNYFSHHDDQNSLISKLYKKVRNYQLRRKIHLVDSLASGKLLLDFGCGTGQFLKKCAEHNYSCTGVEPDTDARQKAALQSGFAIYDSIASIPGAIEFDVITLWHVLEHTRKPWDMLANFREKLKPNGLLLLALPNYKSHDATTYKSYWAGYDVPRHLFHFSSLSIQKLATKHDYKLVSTQPMVFDSFYVSLLSEQYLGRSFLSYPLGFFQGLFSNAKALTTGNYSSLIYILKKDA